MKIIKLIKDKFGHYKAVFNEIPELTYEKIGRDYVGSTINSNGEIVASHWLEKRGYGDAFAGREIKLKMKDGSTETIKDYWFDNGSYKDHGEFMSIGAETLEGLQNCYVYFSYNINVSAFENMVKEYLSYDKIYDYREVEEWCELQYKWYDVIVNGKKIPYMMNKNGEMAEKETKKRVYPRNNVVQKINGRYKTYVYFKFRYKENDRLIRIEANYLETLKATLPYSEEEIRANCGLPSLAEEKAHRMDKKLIKLLCTLTDEERVRLHEMLNT